MLSKLILLLGALIGTFITWSCIQKNKDLLTPPPVTHTAETTQQAVESQPQATPPATTEEMKPIDEAVALEKPSFSYTNTPAEMMELTTAEADQEGNFTEKLENYCKVPLCTKSLHFEDNMETASWKKQIFPLIDFIRQHHIEDATVKIEQQTVTVSGTFTDTAQKDAFTKLLSGFEDEGFTVNQNFTVTPPPKTTVATPSEEPLHETNTSKEAPAPETSTIEVPPAQVEKPKPVTPKMQPQEALEDVQQKQIQQTQSNINTLLKTHPIYFKHNSNELTLDSKKILDKIIDLVNKNTEEIARLRISGHTDASGSAAYNKLLSQKRAEKVRDYLIEHHINVPTLEAIGYGEERPINNNPYAKENRRVEIEISKEANDE